MKIQFRRIRKSDNADGLYLPPPDAPKRMILIEPGLRGKYLAETIIHELMHDWELGWRHDKLKRRAKRAAEELHKAGFRFKR